MTPLSLGFVPLLDAAPLIVAHELGFAGEEGLALDLVRAASWSQLRDLLDSGTVAAAHMLSAMPVARALGLGGGLGGLDVLMVLSLGGQMVGLSPALAGAVRPEFGDPWAEGARLARAGRPLRLGVPFPFSMHALLLRYWLNRAAPDLRPAVVTVPPSRMAEALAAGEIDGFCVGEPWGSQSVSAAGAHLILPGTAIWSQPPEKVLAARTGWAEANPDTAAALMRAVWRAGRWAEVDANRSTLVELLASPPYLDTLALHVEPALAGRILPSPTSDEQRVPGLVSFHAGAASFPWRSQAGWIGAELADRHGLDRSAAMTRARTTFRSDLYRRHLGPAGAPLPRGSDRIEGLLQRAESVPAVHGQVTLARNRFFDGAIFDPSAQL